MRAANINFKKRFSIFGLGVACALGFYLGCGSSEESSGPTGSTPGAVGSSIGGMAGGTGDAGEPNPDAGDSGDASEDAPVDVDFSYDAPGHEGGDACATSSVEAKPLPIDIYLMLDRSASMGKNCKVGQTKNSKWRRAINSIGGFVSDASSAGH